MKKTNNRRRRWLFVAGVFVLVSLFSGAVAYAAVSGGRSLSNPVEIYKAYQNNNFPLMTSGTDDLGKIQQAVTGISTAFKEGIWALVRMTGSFNTEMVKLLFNMDIISTIKQPIVTMTESMASGLLSIGSTVGMCVVALVMIVRFIKTNQLKAALKVFVTTGIIFTSLTILSDSHMNDSSHGRLGLVDQALQIDDAVNAKIVSVNPVFDHTIDTGGKNDSADTHIKKAGDAIASSIFYANVYEPYLLMNYGTSDQNAIRHKGMIDVGKDKKLDRIDGVLDHEDMVSKDWDALVKKESSDFKNKTINYKNNWLQGIFGLFYILTNVLQGVVFFLLGLMRIAMSLLELLLLPILPILLILALFQVLENVLGNYAKAFAIAMTTKGVLGFALILFSSYISLGFTIASKNANTWQKLVTIVVYILSPIAVYMFRHVFIATLTGKLSFSDIPSLVTHPVQQGNKLKNDMEKQAKKKAATRAKAAEEEKKRQQELLKKKQKDGKMIDFRQASKRQAASRNRKDGGTSSMKAGDQEVPGNEAEEQGKDTAETAAKIIPIGRKHGKTAEDLRKPEGDSTQEETFPPKEDSDAKDTDEKTTVIPLRHASPSRIDKKEADKAEQGAQRYRRKRLSEEERKAKKPDEKETTPEEAKSESDIKRNPQKTIYRRSAKRGDGVTEAKIKPKNRRKTATDERESTESAQVQDQTKATEPSQKQASSLSSSAANHKVSTGNGTPVRKETLTPSVKDRSTVPINKMTSPSKALITPNKTKKFGSMGASEAGAPMFETIHPTTSNQQSRAATPPVVMGPTVRQARRVNLPNMQASTIKVRKTKAPKIQKKQSSEPVSIRKQATNKKHGKPATFPKQTKRNE